MTTKKTSGTGNYSLMVHGVAGSMSKFKNQESAAQYLESIRNVLEHGRSVLNENGTLEMDAAIMDRRDLSAGAVAAVESIANPISLARRVVTDSEYVMLISSGAMRFADHCGIERATEDYLYTPDRIEQLRMARQLHKVMLDHDDSEEDTRR